MDTRQKSKKLIKTKIQNSKVEGFAIQIVTVRLSDNRYQKLMELMNKLQVTGNERSERLRLLIDKLYEHHILGNSKRVEEPKEEKDDYDPERYYCDCPYGTYLKEENLVYCTCTYPSVVRWLPKNRKVLPKVCDDHFPRLQALEDFVQKKRGSAPPETTEQTKTFYCALKNGLIPRSQAQCKDINFKCPNVKCLAEVRAGRYPQRRKPQPSKKKVRR